MEQNASTSSGSIALQPPEVVNTWTKSKKYQYLLENFDRILYAYAPKMGVDPELISILHGCLLVATSVKETDDRLALLQRLLSYHDRVSFFATLIVPRVSVDQCDLEKRFWLLTDNGKVTPCCMAPRSVDYGVLFYLLLRMIVSLCYDKAVEIRALALRVVRYLAQNAECRLALSYIGLDMIIVHSCLAHHNNVNERVQALKLLRLIIDSDASLVTRHMANVLVAMAEMVKDDFRRVALDTLRALSIARPELFILAGGIGVVLDAAVDPLLSDISGICVMMVLALLDRPEIRKLTNPSIYLSKLCSIYTDVATPVTPEKIVVQQCHRRSLMHALRSYTGLVAFAADSNGLKSLMTTLALPSLVTGVNWARNHIIDLCHSLLSISTSFDILLTRKSLTHTTRKSQSLIGVGCKSGFASTSLSSSLSSLTSASLSLSPSPVGTSLNLLHVHLTTVLLALINAGLIDSLASLSLAADCPLSAITLLIEMIRLSIALLPKSLTTKLTSFPILFERAVANLHLLTHSHANANSNSNPRSHSTLASVYNMNREEDGADIDNLNNDQHLRIRALRTLTSLFQENLHFFNLAGHTSVLDDSHPITASVLQHHSNTKSQETKNGDKTVVNSSGRQGTNVNDIDSSLLEERHSSHRLTHYTAHGIDIGRLAHDSDASMYKHVFLPWTDKRPQFRSQQLLALKQQISLSTSDAAFQQMLKNSNVLAGKDPLLWNWPNIYAVLEGPLYSPHLLSLALKTKFCKRILSFMRPEKQFFINLALVNAHNIHLKVCVQLFRVLLSASEGRQYPFFHLLLQQLVDLLKSEVHRAEHSNTAQMVACQSTNIVNYNYKLQTELDYNDNEDGFIDVSYNTEYNSHPYNSDSIPSVSRKQTNIAQKFISTVNNVALNVTGGSSNRSHSPDSQVSDNDINLSLPSHIRPFSRSSVQHKMAREYIFLLCSLSSTPFGNAILTQYNVWQILEPLAACTSHDYLTRLFVIHLDYTNSIEARNLLQHWLVAGSTFTRRTIVHHLSVLAANREASFSMWGVDVLIALLHAPDVQVSLVALSVLESICQYDSLCLYNIVKRAPILFHFGPFSTPLMMLMVSTPDGFDYACRTGWAQHQFTIWKSNGCSLYVENQELALTAALTAISQQDEDDTNDLDANTNSTNVKTKAKTKTHTNTNTNTASTTAPLPPDPSNSVWPYYSLSSHVHNSLFQPLYSAHDNYLSHRVEDIPWNIEVVVENNNPSSSSSSSHSNRVTPLLVDVTVNTGCADAGVPVLSAGSLPSSVYTLGTNPEIIADDDDDTVEPVRWNFKLVHNEQQGNTATQIIANILDMDGRPCGFPIDANAVLHSRISVGSLPPSIPSLAAKCSKLHTQHPQHLPDDPPPIYLQPDSVVSADAAKYQASFATKNHVSPSHLHLPEVQSEPSAVLALNNNVADQHIRKCTPQNRKKLIRSIYHSDSSADIYSDTNTAINTTNWSSPSPASLPNPYHDILNTSVDVIKMQPVSPHITYKCNLPTFTTSSFYYLDGDVRWNFAISHTNHSQLLLTSVWFRLPPSHDTTPSVSTLPHLYAQLSHTTQGLKLLYGQQVIQTLHATLKATTSTCLEKRVAMWSLAQIATSPYGIQLLNKLGVVEDISRIATSDPSLVLRGAAIYSLGLFVATDSGKSLLNRYGWESEEPGSGSTEEALISCKPVIVPKNIQQCFSIDQPHSDLHTAKTKSTISLSAPTDSPLQEADSETSPLDLVGIWTLDDNLGLTTVPQSGLDGRSNVNETQENSTLHEAQELLMAATELETVDMIKADNGASNLANAYTVNMFKTNEVLKAALSIIDGYISNLCNNVTQRHAIMRLKTIKTSYPVFFTDPSVFSHVYSLLSHHSMKLCARRFIIIELFDVKPWDRDIDRMAILGSEYDYGAIKAADK